jgi:hypothetical protein
MWRGSPRLAVCIESTDYYDYYTWQSDIPGFNRECQELLRGSTALV